MDDITQDYAGPERRRGPANLSDAVRLLEGYIDTKFDRHLRDENTRNDALYKELREMKDMIAHAFPEQDAVAHREYHEEVIRFMKEKRALWADIRSKALSGLVWSGMIALGTAVWHTLKTLWLVKP